MQARKKGAGTVDNKSAETRAPITDNLAMPDAATTAYYVDFRERLVRLRTTLGWTQEDMAKALGISLPNYQKYEIRSKFPLHALEQLARVTHRDLDYIVTGRSVTRLPTRRTA